MSVDVSAAQGAADGSGPDVAGWLTGSGLPEDLFGLSEQVASGSWLAAGLSSVAIGAGVASLVEDPLAGVVSMGLSWVLDHVQPLRGWFEDLTGDHDAVVAHADEWAAIAVDVDSVGTTLTDRVRADLAGMSGVAIDRYRTFGTSLGEHVTGVARSASSVAGALRWFADIVQAVHDLVRDALSDVIGLAVSCGGELAFSGGLALPHVIGRVSARVAHLSVKIGRFVQDLVTSVTRLVTGVGSLDEVLELVLKEMDGIADALRRGVRAYRPGIGDIPTAVSPFVPVRDGDACAST
ncbi:hypothetical protein [Cellulomonas composti]|uniref:PPE family domain-containing protein n=1 Tax=Cellulomonas composti TaxID=266130 RepID=A0A511JB36_9CELL|nr:hypothetical protein [Cellulomonas composti]GEL94999.1 hypothetical protein CCO02nite_16570 [Cellulomonas composti]